MRVAVVGSGVSGLAAAHRLRDAAHVTLFEAGSRFGGHARTVDVTLPTDRGLVKHGVDTGFLVFNERTYPVFIALLRELGVASVRSDMSFSVRAPRAGRHAVVEWGGRSLGALFAQPPNAIDPRFWRMLRDILRFNARATALATNDGDEALRPLDEFLDAHRFSREFRDWYLLPMLGSIWSAPTVQMLRFPVRTLARFCHNHGLLQLRGRPKWRTVAGGSRSYVERIIRGLVDARTDSPVLEIARDAHGVLLRTAAAGWERFDRLLLATHADDSLRLLGSGATADERVVLGAFGYQTNHAVLHTDRAALPSNPRVWSAWNYEAAAPDGPDAGRVCLHYLVNRLQPLPWPQPVIVSLNPVRPIASDAVLDTHAFRHPVFDAGAIAAQPRVAALQGAAHTWFAGAWTGHGFHEDGLRSGLAAAEDLLRAASPGSSTPAPWWIEPSAPRKAAITA